MAYKNELYESAKEQRNFLLNWIEQNPQINMIQDYFNVNRIERIAIYGMGGLCPFTIKMIQSLDVHINCILDKNNQKEFNGLRVLNIDEFVSSGEKVDCIIVSAIFYFNEIYDEIKRKMGIKTKVISLEDVLYGSIMGG